MRIGPPVAGCSNLSSRSSLWPPQAACSEGGGSPGSFFFVFLIGGVLSRCIQASMTGLSRMS